MENIADAEQDGIIDVVKKAKFFGITMDGSTDEGTVEQETLFVRVCVEGKVVTKFLSIGEPISTSSANLYTFVWNELKRHDLSEDVSFVGFGCDGAANMMGKKGGLVALLKKDFPELHATHCLAHRLELSFRDVVKADKKYERLSALLLGIYYFYKRSPKQRKTLKTTFQVMNIKGTLPHRVSGSRWMPHMQRALNSLFASFPACVAHLQNESHTNPKAEGLVKIMCNYQVMVFATVLMDILNPLVKLSLLLQSRDITLADAHLMVDATLTLLQSLKSQKSNALLKLEENKELAGVSLTVMGVSINSDSLLKKKVDEISKAITSRFGDMKEMQFTELSNFRNWPRSAELKEYGNDHVFAATERFRNSLEQQGIQTNSEELQSQWTLLKTLVQKKYGDNLVGVSWINVWNIFSEMGVKDILCLMDLLRTLPATSVSNEAVFNQMKLTKTNRRQRLSNAHLNDCMLIRAESMDIQEFDPTPAVDKWMMSCKQPRRVNYKRESKKTVASQQTQIVEEVDEGTEQNPVVVPEADKNLDTNEETDNNPIVKETDTSRGEIMETDEYESDTDSESDNEQTEQTNEILVRNIVYEIERKYN